jgi:hypothetical protein
MYGMPTFNETPTAPGLRAGPEIVANKAMFSFEKKLPLSTLQLHLKPWNQA